MAGNGLLVLKPDLVRVCGLAFTETLWKTNGYGVMNGMVLEIFFYRVISAWPGTLAVRGCLSVVELIFQAITFEIFKKKTAEQSPYWVWGAGASCASRSEGAACSWGDHKGGTR